MTFGLSPKSRLGLAYPRHHRNPNPNGSGDTSHWLKNEDILSRSGLSNIVKFAFAVTYNKQANNLSSRQ